MTSERMTWDEAARLEVEKLTIFARERLRQRAEDLVQRQGRSTVTLADLEAARAQGQAAMASHDGMAGRAGAPAPRGPETPPEAAWPVVAGAYRLGDPAGSVAVCTLAGVELARTLNLPPGVAMAGHVFTENLGVEKIVMNTVSNPNIRVLLLAGTESRHFVGQTLLALAANGLDTEHRVVGSRGPTPVLAGLPDAAVALFQAKVEVVDLIGEQDAGAILARAAALAAEGRPAWPETWTPEAPRLRAEVQERMGRPSDPAGFLLVSSVPTMTGCTWSTIAAPACSPTSSGATAPRRCCTRCSARAWSAT